ncbi:hypothetical protein [Conexibacter woesei]|uniref:hypothetical protein n=1 Tax=Conexibacter woesei TaxID=191495 RepID=UPI0004175C01|nr:hypothetical protein [Conexibacter woesei]
MPLDLPLSALRNHTKDRILDVDAFVDQVLDPGATPDTKPAPRDPAAEGEGGAQPSERP